MCKGDRVMDELFPKIQKSIETLIEDEEGNIPGNRLLMLGTMVIILGSLFSTEAFAGHRSHSSHRSHQSHSSGSGGGHESHVSHQSHESHSSSTDWHSNHSNHASHISHTSHSNTGAHSNSRYSTEGDVTYGPSAAAIDGITAPPVSMSEALFKLPEINQNIQAPKGTPGAAIIPNLAVPVATPATKIDSGNMKIPPETEAIE